MADAVTSKIFLEAFKLFNDAAIDSALEAEIRKLASQQTVLPTSSMLDSEEYVGSPVLKVLRDNMSTFRSTPGMAHVLYAPPSTGKTAALRYFLQVVLKKAGAPALMISRNANADDYLGNIADALSIREGRSDALWIASLVASLVPRPGEQLQHAPLLVLDELNFRGREDKNVFFAYSFARFVYEKRFTVLFVTQNLDMARALCQLNEWQKIGPLPHLTVPERWSLKRNERPPENYIWNTMEWTTQGLTLMILKRHLFRSKFDHEVDDTGCLPWLADVSNPTAALTAAHKRLTIISCESGSDPSYEFPAGFFEWIE